MPKTLSDHRPIKDVGLTTFTSARANPAFKERNESEIPRTIGGATVEFADGASVSKISLMSDFSAVFTSDLSPHTSVQELVDFLIGSGFPQVTHDCVRLKHIPEKLRKTGLIKVRDPDFANKLLQCLQDTPLEERAITQLRSHGTLNEECTPYPQKGGSRTKIIAKFSEAEAARNAVKKMHETSLDPSSNDKMQVTPLVSIKLSVSSRILAAIRPQLDTLVDQTWRTDYVQIKSYKTLGKQYTQVRIFGQSREPVAKAKSAVEKLLAGQIATDGHGPITDPFYFKPSSKSFLNDLGGSHGVFIHQDLRRSVLRLYGDHNGIERVESALVARLWHLPSKVDFEKSSPL
ncbi:hypothetical protein J4E89_001773 [Alternaria sp. Ai002NY15]|nr:hypothetical protein J4E89_001773 [Alternaria sp. Ai002NY15]